MRNVERRSPTEVSVLDGNAPEFYFPSAVAHHTDVTVDRVAHIRRLRSVDREKEMVDVAVIPVELAEKTVVEEREVDTHVKLLFLLPLEIGVHVVCGSVGRKPFACRLIVPVSVIVGKAACSDAVGDRVVAGYTVGDTYLEIAEPVAGAFHEVLAADAPASRNSPEVTPTMVSAELTAAFVTDRCADHILVVVAIVGTREI